MKESYYTIEAFNKETKCYVYRIRYQGWWTTNLSPKCLYKSKRRVLERKNAEEQNQNLIERGYSNFKVRKVSICLEEVI